MAITEQNISSSTTEGYCSTFMHRFRNHICSRQDHSVLSIALAAWRRRTAWPGVACFFEAILSPPCPCSPTASAIMLRKSSLAEPRADSLTTASSRTTGCDSRRWRSSSKSERVRFSSSVFRSSAFNNSTFLVKFSFSSVSHCALARSLPTSARSARSSVLACPRDDCEVRSARSILCDISVPVLVAVDATACGSL